MKNSILLIMSILMIVLAGGCGSNEIIRIGIPFQNDGTSGVEFHADITDSEAITELRKIVGLEESVEKPQDLAEQPDIFFTLDRPKESVSEIQRYVWYQDDGSSILSNEENGQDYFSLSMKQTADLKNIIE